MESLDRTLINLRFSDIDLGKKKQPCHAKDNPDNKVHGANMGPTWVLSALAWPYVGPMNLAIREGTPTDSVNHHESTIMLPIDSEVNRGKYKNQRMH